MFLFTSSTAFVHCACLDSTGPLIVLVRFQEEKKITQKNLFSTFPLPCIVLFFSLLCFRVFWQHFSTTNSTTNDRRSSFYCLLLMCFHLWKKTKKLILPCILLLVRTWSPNNGTKWPNPFNWNVTNRIWEKWRIGVICGRISKCDRLRVNTHPLNNMFPSINNEQHHCETISKREYFSDLLQKPSFGERLKLGEEPPAPKDEHLLLSWNI